MAIVDEFYLAALSRYPTDDERQFWQQKLVDKVTPNAQRALLEDFVWSLMTCHEFQTNH